VKRPEAGASCKGALSASPRSRPGLAAVLGAVVLTVSLTAPATAAATVQTKITSILATYHLAGNQTGVRVYDLHARRTVYSRNVGARLRPASNMKLVTSATALARWGPYYSFKTELYTPPGGPDVNGVLRGNVYIKGYGDPSLSTPWFQRNVLRITTSSIKSFVTALQDLGVTKIVGHVVGDESYFDSQRSVANWRPGMTQWCGPLSALSLNEGSSNGTRVSNPPLFVSRTVTRLLEAAGIDVTGGAWVGRVPRSFSLVYTEYSAPLAVIVAAMNKPSDNFFAEELTKGLGKAFAGGGTTAEGTKVLGAYLRSVGIAATDIRVRDGSGLSYEDWLTARGVNLLLRRATAREWFPYYFGSLPIAGFDGTLADRMRRTRAQGNLRAKTGTLNVSSCLSGYVTNAAGHRLVFSIFMNGQPLSTYSARRAQDAIGVALANWR
jgi:D-alanyl-D-alanine carboxypeptidase/D-alanyl-D-alanine-endopeptidase (penicillin-binding protein 4)